MGQRIGTWGLLVLSVLPLVNCKATGGTGVKGADQGLADDTQWWEGERQKRQVAYDAFINSKEQAGNFFWFSRWPLGNSGTPYLIFSLLPTIFPEIWGDQANFGLPVGLAPDPKSRVPTTFGIASPKLTKTPFSIVAFSCATCHLGRVRTEDQQVVKLYGAPSTTFDTQGYSQAMLATVSSPKFTFETFAPYIDPQKGKPAGWFYRYDNVGSDAEELVERQTFMAAGAQVMEGVAAGTKAGVGRMDAVLKANVYNSSTRPNFHGGTPGQLDAMGAASASTLPPGTDRSLWPHTPAYVDIMSVWRQDDRKLAQWTGGIIDPIYRNLGAEVGTIGDPKAISFENVMRTSRLLGQLPPPPYPFPVKKALADRGQALFQTNCAGCHKIHNEQLYLPEQIGTDPNRIHVFTTVTRPALIAALRSGCSDESVCNVPDERVLNVETGYMAAPLDGIWARAPYLHNGSIPTLRHLLVPEMRQDVKTFYRGNLDYDQKNVGFAWERKIDPTAHSFDTGLEGMSNAGHTGTNLRADGGSWQGEELEALLEYLKTL